jgi:hypothetical protein
MTKRGNNVHIWSTPDTLPTTVGHPRPPVFAAILFPTMVAGGYHGNTVTASLPCPHTLSTLFPAVLPPHRNGLLFSWFLLFSSFFSLEPARFYTLFLVYLRI